MQLSRTSALQKAVAEVVSIDVSCLSGPDASSLLDILVPLSRQLSAFISACSARAVSANQHTLAGSRSGSSWIAQKIGVSEKQARQSLDIQKRLEELPEVSSAVSSGEISMEKASVIARAAEGDEATARKLLSEPSIEGVQRKAQEIAARDSRDGLRKKQYMSIRADSDGMILFNGRLLPERVAGWLGRWNKASRVALCENEKSPQPLPADVVRAETFSEMLGETGGKSSSTITFHVDYPAWQRGWIKEGERCEIAGLGPVPVAVVEDFYDDSALRLIVTEANKILWYSEEDQRRRDGHVPEFVKRAIKSRAYDQCETDDCFERAVDVDHALATFNGGDGQLSNLAALCKPDHDSKTKRDVPWTIPRFFSKKKRAAKEVRPLEDETADELFPDTG